MAYYGNVNPDLLEMVPLTARHVLELGSGEGALAAAYRERNPKARYTAIEMHEPSAAKAAEVVDRLINADFETMSDDELTGGTLFDVIVMGDVLEHFSDPDAVLRRLHRLLAPDGHLAISVPNVSHWSALFHLINGRWPSQDSGLFDRTHLRFFTLESLRDTLEGAGFRTIKGKPRQFLLDKPTAETWIPPLADLAEKMGVNRNEFLRRSSTLQYVVLAQKADRPAEPPLHLRTAAFAVALMEARNRSPSAFLASMPDLTVSYAERDMSLPSLPVNAPKVWVVQRAIPASANGWIDHLAKAIRAGWIVVSEWDDHPDLIAGAIDRDAADMWPTIDLAHAVQTSTEPLAEAFRARNPQVQVFPNAAFTLMPFPPPRVGPVRIFHGAGNRERFSVPVARSLHSVLDRHPDAHFEVVHDRAFFDALPTSRKRFQSMLRYADYLETMGACDIVLSPLEGAGPERFKSDIKYVEAASRGGAMIASPAIYEGTIRDGENGLIARDIADWSPALERLLDDADLRRRLARAAWEEVRDSRMFADQVALRRDWYRGLWERRHQLTAALIERVPALGAAIGSVAGRG